MVRRLTRLIASVGALGLGLAPSPSPAQDYEKELTIYASHPSEMVDFFAKDFGDRYGVKITTIKAGTGELLNRIRAEQARPTADVMWGGFADTGASAPDLFDQYRSSALARVDAKMIDPAGYNTPFGASTMVIMYNKKLVRTEEAPKTWADLRDPKWAGKVVHADPSKSSSAFAALATWLTIYGKDDKGWQFIEEMTRNQTIVIRSSLVFQQIGRGEYPVGVTYEEGAFKYVLAGEAGIVYPADGSLLEPEGMFIVKGAPHPKAARLFADYLLTEDAQTKLATQFPGRRPTLQGIKTHPAMLPAEQLKIVDFDSRWAAEKRKDILDQMQKVMVKTQR
ncbi:MAG: extracellular solute-binding protein [Pseudomonadota bacterium]